MAYTTDQGDTWDIIAKNVYGAEKHADFLMASNPKLLDVFVFSSGVTLETPELTEANDELPPWRTGDE